MFDYINGESEDGSNICYKGENNKENCMFLGENYYDKKRGHIVAFCVMFLEAKARHPSNIMTQSCSRFKSIKQGQEEVKNKRAKNKDKK